MDGKARALTHEERLHAEVFGDRTAATGGSRTEFSREEHQRSLKNVTIQTRQHCSVAGASTKTVQSYVSSMDKEHRRLDALYSTAKKEKEAAEFETKKFAREEEMRRKSEKKAAKRNKKKQNRKKRARSNSPAGSNDDDDRESTTAPQGTSSPKAASLLSSPKMAPGSPLGVTQTAVESLGDGSTQDQSISPRRIVPRAARQPSENSPTGLS